MPPELVFSEHAIDRMVDWDVTVDGVRDAYTSGETVEEYEDGASLVFGRAGVRPLHLVVRVDEASATVFVITVDELMEDRWEAGFMKRRR